MDMVSHKALLFAYLVERGFNKFPTFRIDNIELDGEFVRFSEICKRHTHRFEYHKVTTMDLLCWVVARTGGLNNVVPMNRSWNQ